MHECIQSFICWHGDSQFSTIRTAPHQDMHRRVCTNNFCLVFAGTVLHYLFFLVWFGWLCLCYFIYLFIYFILLLLLFFFFLGGGRCYSDNHFIWLISVSLPFVKSTPNDFTENLNAIQVYTEGRFLGTNDCISDGFRSKSIDTCMI